MPVAVSDQHLVRARHIEFEAIEPEGSRFLFRHRCSDAHAKFLL
jgi:hypothetical protein